MNQEIYKKAKAITKKNNICFTQDLYNNCIYDTFRIFIDFQSMIPWQKHITYNCAVFVSKQKFL